MWGWATAYKVPSATGGSAQPGNVAPAPAAPEPKKPEGGTKS